MKETSKLLTIEEAAKVLNMSQASLGLISLGSLIPLKSTIVGKRRLFVKSDLLDWAKRREQAKQDGLISCNNGNRHSR